MKHHIPTDHELMTPTGMRSLKTKFAESSDEIPSLDGVKR